MHGGDFTISQEEHGEALSLVITGELDLMGASELEACLTGLTETRAPEIELDLRGVSFIDSSGLRAILVCKGICASLGVPFYVVPSEDPGPMKLFETAGLGAHVPWRAAREPAGD